MNNKRFGSLSSSENPEALAATVKAIILALASVIILIGRNFGFEITGEQIVLVAGQLGLAVSSIWFCFGVIRKIVIHFAK